MSNMSSRRAAAIVELALFLPVYFLIVTGTIETCRMLYIRQSLKIAAYECARLGLVPGMSSSDLETQCDAVLLGRRIKDYQLSTIPSDLATLRYGDVLTTTVTIAAKPNALVAQWFYRTEFLVESVKIMAEQNELQ